MTKTNDADRAAVDAVVIASLESHRERCNRNGVSRWYVTVDGKRRRIELQEYKRRLYLVGCLYSGLSKVLEFEASLASITMKLGRVRSR